MEIEMVFCILVITVGTLLGIAVLQLIKAKKKKEVEE